MFEIDTLAIVGLAVLCAGGLAYALIYPFLSGEVKADERRQAVAGTVARPIRRTEEASVKRPSVEETLKEIDRRRQNASRPPLSIQIAQAGLTWTKQRFLMASGALGIVGFLGVMIVGVEPLWALAAGLALGLGLPRWILGFLKRRRLAAFLN